MKTRQLQSEALKITLIKYGYSTTRVDKDFVQMVINYLIGCLEYFKTTRGFEDNVASYEADLAVLVTEQNKLAF